MAGQGGDGSGRSSRRNQVSRAPAVRTSRRRGAASEADISRLTGLIYDAALDPQAWPAVLERYARAIGASCANAHARDPRTSTFYFIAASGIDSTWMVAYQDHYASVEPWLAPALPLPSGSVWTSPMLVPDRTLECSEYYNDFLEPQDLRHICSLHALNEHDAFAAISALRPKWMDDFGEDDLRLARQIHPHVQRTVQIHQRLVNLETQRDSLGEALDRIAIGIILLDGTDHIAFANRRARELFREGDGLAVRNATLHAAASRDTARLRKLIASARRSTVEAATKPGGLTAVARPSGKRAYTILVTPIRIPELAGSAGRAVVAVFVTDPEQDVEMPSDALRHIYKLTEAEAALAVRLSTGLSLAVAAEQLGITKETARTRLKVVFSKTDTHRQAELVRLVLTTLGDLQIAE